MAIVKRYAGAPWLSDSVTGDIVGVKDPDGSELLFMREGHKALVYDLTSQSQTVINTASPISFNTPVIQDGITLSAGTKLVFSRSGTFQFTLTAQLKNTDVQAAEFMLWGRANGVDMPNTLTTATVPSSHGGVPGSLMFERSYFGQVVAGMYIEVMWATDNLLVTIPYTAPQVAPPINLPASPSAYLSIHEVGR